MTVDKKESKILLSIANEAALRAGKKLSKAGKASRIVCKDSRRDVKIAADIESENIIVDFLRKESAIPILSEEKGSIGASRTGERFRWIVDPLDGTLNFSRGIPICCVSIGLWEEKSPVLGAIYDFNTSEMYLGVLGLGAWRNNEKIKVSSVGQKERAVLLTGFPTKTDFSTLSLSSFVNDIRAYKKVRLLGSAALSLAYVASGKAEAYYEKDIRIWDVAAGLAIIIAAGGRYSLKAAPDGKRFTVMASNRNLYENEFK